MRKKLKKKKLSIISRLKVSSYESSPQAQKFGLLDRRTIELECDGCVLYCFCLSILNRGNMILNGKVLPVPCTLVERRGPVKFPEMSEVYKNQVENEKIC
jgi:hypothetical protein